MAAVNPLQFVSRRGVTSFLAGLVLLLALVLFRGPGLIAGQIGAVGFTFVVLFGLSLSHLLLQTVVWHSALRPARVSFLTLVKRKLAGEAMNQLSHLVAMRGDTLNIQLLRSRFQIDAADSVVFSRGIRNFPLLILMMFGSSVAKLPLSPAVRGGWEETERALRKFLRERKTVFYQSIFLSVVGQGLVFVEILLIGKAILPDLTAAHAVILCLLTPLVKMLAFPLPGALGVLEGSYALVLGLAFGGIGCAAGFSIMLTRRLVSLGWLVIGLGVQGNPFRTTR